MVAQSKPVTNMGQFTSSSAPSEEQSQLPPVQNINQFQDRVRQLIQNKCLSRQEKAWFRSVFSKFSSTSGTSPTWNESDLVEVLGTTLPNELKPTLNAAGPLIYRSMIRIGSFPYQNQPDSALTADVALVAVIILLRRHESSASAISDIGNGDENEEVRWADWLRRILFQSMVVHDNSAADRNSKRSDFDDEDLLRAHKFVSNNNKWRDWERNPKVAHSGPPIISASELPSSRSQYLGGSIPNSELEALIKLLLANQLYLTGNGPDILVREENQLNAGVNSIMAALRQPNEASGITWESFNRVFSESPSIFSGFTRLFALLLLDGGIKQEHVDSATRIEATKLLRGAYSVSQSRNLPTGSVFNLPVLAQVTTFLPEGRLALQSASVLYTAIDKFEITSLQKELSERTQQLLLLISGLSSSSRTPVSIGAFLPGKGQEQQQIETGKPQIRASLFQLRPTHRISSSSQSDLTVERGTSKGVEIRLAEKGLATVRLTLNEQTQTASFYPREQNENDDTVSFDVKVDAVDLIGFTTSKNLFDLLTDKAFFY
ncbi:hypothetical protein GGR53DRAFT_498223 [Hypoxylon sp. FL1150]|nr:hypothetical protein GGR53DRAFT_498223 [Hypoxylon sp. FL1150]